jgi:mannose-1-phosphate guanylyltransferase
MVMAPSDHWIENEKAFQDDIGLAFEAARNKDRIVTLGINPTFPNTGYGYIKFDSTQNERVKRVDKFTEKPVYEVAKTFLQEGNYLWNAGIFIWNVNFIVRSFEQNLPEMFRLFASNSEVLNSSVEKDFIKEHYPKAENISIDYGILEKEEGTVHVISATFDWTDLGTWGSLYTESPKDEQENVVLNCRLLEGDSSGNIINSASNKVVVVEGLNDYIIVDEKEILLIVPKEKEQEIKQIRERVQQKFGENLG